MNIQGIHQQTLRFDKDKACLFLLDQTKLPFQVEWLQISGHAGICHAIKTMQVRGAPAIGAAAAWGMVFAVSEKLDLPGAAHALKATRPTAVNLAWAVDRMLSRLANIEPVLQYPLACAEAELICQEDIAACEAIGNAGAALIKAISTKKAGKPVNILTHCNAGWLATVDWGTALAPVYKAQAMGIDVHVWVDETRPRNQGALLTVFELREQGIPHTLVSDNSGGHLMQHGQVDLCLVGSDRTAANGDVCNKIGTYLKALAAWDNQVPFYVALPTSTIDWAIPDGSHIPIEDRHADEVLKVHGCDDAGLPTRQWITLPGTAVANPAFDVTPARYVSGLITEHGIWAADTDSLATLKGKLDNA